MLEGADEVIVLLAPEIDRDIQAAMTRALLPSIRAGCMLHMRSSSNMLRDEAAFRLGGVRAVKEVPDDVDQ